MAHPEEVMRETARIMKTGDKALILDFFAGEREGDFSGIMGRVEFREKIYTHLKKAGLNKSINPFAANLFMKIIIVSWYIRCAG